MSLGLDQGWPAGRAEDQPPFHRASAGIPIAKAQAEVSPGLARR